MSISLVVGLGNPGRLYEHTRHNLGWVVLDALAERHRLMWKPSAQFQAELARWEPTPGRTCWLAKPQTFMNASGQSIGPLMRFYKLAPAEVAVVYDDVGLDFGLLKIAERGSAGGHNGVTSLIEHLGADFVRYRLGIGPKTPAQMDLADFVLGKFPPEQQISLSQNLASLVDGLELLINRGPAHAMNQLNRRNS